MRIFTVSEILALMDKEFRRFLVKIPPEFAIYFYSNARRSFLNNLCKETPFKPYTPSRFLSRNYWGLNFATPLFNSAGMFKNGDGYELVMNQGAGAFLAGTTTYLPRKGNKKLDTLHPFAPYPKSKAASNWMGLPNIGHYAVAKKLSKIQKSPFCPLGISIAADPDLKELDALNGIIDGLNIYEKAGVDFVELNESCPNVMHNRNIDKATGLDSALVNRLEYIYNNFIKSKKRRIPIIAKFSNDTDSSLVFPLLDILVDLKFDGINFGNTSTNYQQIRADLDESDYKLFDFFTEKFGGGVSGNPLRKSSLLLASNSAKYINKNYSNLEFYVIRTGGIDCINDLRESNSQGIALNQWFSGYFDSFARYGHILYKKMFEPGKNL